MGGFGAEGCGLPCTEQDPSGCHVGNRLQRARTDKETVGREATAIVQAGDIQWLGPGRFSAVGRGRDQMWDVSEGSSDCIYS